MKRGAIPVEESLTLALQIAEALEAAHEKGVIHRDLKPANIKVTPDDKVKVLDFGLAKAFAGDGSDANLSQSPTLSMAATRQGVILGTAAYMSPEQARGQEVDKRADVWAFGVVLFEMLTVRGTFDGRTVSDVLAGVLAKEPQWKTLPLNLHPRLRLLLERCLEKESKDRYGAISDARVDIQKVLSDPDGLVQPAAKVARASAQSKLPWVATFVLGVLIAGVAVWTLRPAPEPGLVGRFDYDLPETQTLVNPSRALVALAPDGRQFVYSTVEGLYLRSLNALDARLSPGGDTNVRNPVFSPDGQWLAYYTSRQLKKISTSGGAPVTLCDASNPFGMSWGADDMILFGQPEGIMSVSANGGTPELIIEAEEGESFDGPQLLPGGNSILFSVGSDRNRNWDAGQIVVQSLETRERSVVWSGGSDARYVETGHLVYAVDDVLFAIPFDLDTLEVSGSPAQVVEGLTRASASASANYGVSERGSLMYLSAVSIGNSSLVWVDREGREEPLPFDSAPYYWPRVSPNGMHVAVSIAGPEGPDVWIGELARGTLSRLTTTPGVDNVPLWTPDNERVVFASLREQLGRFSFFSGRADGTGPVEKLLTSEAGGNFKPYGWSPDAMSMVFDYGPPPSLDIGLLEMEGEESWRPLLQTEANEATPALSPDGTWIAYVSDQTGQPEIYVQRFPDLGDRLLISSGGGTGPLWSPDGNELFYRNDDQMMAVSIDREPTFTPGRPVVLFEGEYQLAGAISRDYDLPPDGQRFLMIKAADENAAAPQIHIVLNWFEELKERVPVPW